MKDQTLDLLENLKKNEFDLTSVADKRELTYELLSDIGNKDSYIRDELIYPTLARLLYRDHLSEDELLEILKVLYSEENLMYQVGEINDSVFTRTFSSLQLAVLFFKHNEKPFIELDAYIKYYNQFLDYYSKEKDLRGYFDEEGWAHSIAHSADVFKQFAQAKELGDKELFKMLVLIKDKFVQSEYLFVNNEDERTVSAIELILNRDLISHDDFVDWLKSFTEYTKEEDYQKEYIINTNIKNLLRSIYFRVADYHEEIEDVLYIINPFKK